MRKLLVVVMVVALIGVAAGRIEAAEGSELEISGNVTTVTGWQSPKKNTLATWAADGLLNDGLAAAGATGTPDNFGFFVDQVELDLAKGFGENIRVRADIDFSPHRAPAASGAAAGVGGVGTAGNAGGVYLEQGYVTANIPVGNGAEFLVGRFNSGIGLDPIDRHDLSTISFSTPHRSLLPHSLTGVRLGYDASEATRVELFVVNDLADGTPGGPAARVIGFQTGSANIPSGGLNLTYAWGDTANKSWARLSGALGPEQTTNTPESFLGDLSANVAVSDAMWVGAEGVFRQDNATVNQKYIGGQLKGKYAFSDVWDGTLRYGLVWDINTGDNAATPPVAANPLARALVGAGAPGVGLGAKGTMHTLSVATGYQISDGARFVVEGGVDVNRPTAGGGNGYTPALAGMFAYSF